jgi:D-alanyl-lipoteichoic acid acyltransferase DltB (MBOAT superfamily)
MSFNTVAFLAFFALALSVAAVTLGRTRIVALTVLSYAFYAVSGPVFLPLLFGASLTDFFIGRTMARATRAGHRRLLLAVSITVNLGVLAVFKYAGFFSATLTSILHAMGVPADIRYADVPLPPGISFYTFGAMSYTIDIYRRELAPVQRPLDFFLFVAFFPHLVAGPIVRAAQFIPQIASAQPLRPRDTVAGLEGIAVGLFKKMVIADTIAQYVQSSFTFEAAPANVALVAVLFSVQIYCDFSGYTDVARGTARILGFHFPENFTWPYFSVTVQEFWRRWHRTLSFWIRDYVYVSLGGGRVPAFRRALNVTITWFLCGLWHGAAWNFVLWGLFHGTFVQLSRLMPVGTRATRTVSAAVTFGIVSLGWLLFRAPSVGYGLRMILKVFGIEVGEPFSLARPMVSVVSGARFFEGFPYCGWGVVAGVTVLAIVHYASYRAAYSFDTRPMLVRFPYPAVAVIVGVVLAGVFLFAGPLEPFIYFAF